MLEGMLVVDKPTGMTSFDVIRRLRRVLRLKALGHTGTLDPNASGVLCVCVGWALKLLRFLEDDHKVYRARAKLGEVTTTDDAEGEIVERRTVAVEKERVLACLNQFVGTIEQVPPQFSAIKVAGRRAYERAREGDEVVLAARKVRIDRIDVRSYEAPLLSFDVTCGKGTYIRSLCRDFGVAVRCGAHLEALRRLESGVAKIDDAVRLDSVADLLQSGQPLPLIPCWDMLSHFESVNLSREDGLAITHGRRPLLPDEYSLEPGTMVRLRSDLCSNQQEKPLLLAVAQVDEGRCLRPIRVRPQPLSS